MGQFPVLFDASSPYPIPTIGGKFITGLGQKEGMANVGESRDESLAVDRHLFCTELDLLLTYYDKLSPMDFFTLVHVAYEKALKNEGEKSTIFDTSYFPVTSRCAIFNSILHPPILP